MLAPRPFVERCSGELLRDYLNEAWRRVGRMLFGSSYEELTGYDRDLTEQYHPPTGVISRYDGHHRTFAPPELVVEVNRAYFRLRQYNKIDAWFDAKGFDYSEKPISKEEFEKLLNGSAKPATKLTDEELLQLQPGFVKDYLAQYSADSRPRPTQKELRKKWSIAGHGARFRDELDDELEKQARDKGILLKPGRQKKRAK